MIPFCDQNYLPVFFGITLIVVSIGLMAYSVMSRAEPKTEPIPPGEAS